MKNAATTAKQAVTQSIVSNERARLFAREDISGWDDRSAATTDELKAYGLEDWTRENDDSIDAWGTHEGKEWRVLIVDGLEGRHG
jgi:hypothetical protein